MLKKVLESGGGGSDTKNATGFRAPDPLNPGVTDACAVEGSVDPGHDILRIFWAVLEPCVVGELKGAIVHGCHRGRGGPLLVGLGIWFSLNYLPALRAEEAATDAKDLGGPWGWRGLGTRYCKANMYIANIYDRAMCIPAQNCVFSGHAYTQC